MASKLLNLLPLHTPSLLKPLPILPATLAITRFSQRRSAATSGRCKPRPSSASSVAPSSSSQPPTASSTEVAATKPTHSKPRLPHLPRPHTANTGSAVEVRLDLVGLTATIPLSKTSLLPEVSSIYSWSPWKPAGSDALGLEFAPMLWGPKQISDFQRLAVAGYATTAPWLQRVPESPRQANLDPGYAAQLWRQHMEPLTSKGYLSFPPPSPPAPVESPGCRALEQLRRLHCRCRCRSLVGTDPQEFIAYVQDFHHIRQRYLGHRVCLRELLWWFSCSKGQVQNFMDTVTAFMDGADYVRNTLRLGVMHDMSGVNPLNQLMGADGPPTALGWDYIT